MFPGLPPAQFGTTDAENEANLGTLAGAMVNEFDAPKDGPDGEESGIPALYTYLGQFLDHDVTFDPVSTLHAANDPNVENFRTPALDLDSVYGDGPEDQPYIYNADNSFLLGQPITGSSDWLARDLPRNSASPARALIGDPRNDENSIVSQLQGLFLRFHNRKLAEGSGHSFADAQKALRHHYQYVVLNDFLPRLVSDCVLSQLKTDGKWDRSKIKFYDLTCEPYLPFEFAVAAYRLGHSMVRPGYRLNDNDATLLPIFPVSRERLPQGALGLPEGLTGFRAMNPLWGIDWARFIDTELRHFGEEDKDIPENKKRLQLAYRIDTSAAFPIGALPGAVASGPSSLPLRNLLRGWRLKLPSGQEVAKAMGETPLSDEEIRIGTFDDDALKNPGQLKPITDNGSIFAGNCPLWTYILAETRFHVKCDRVPTLEGNIVKTTQLGKVGGRIVAETLLGLLFGDKTSYLNDPTPAVPITGYALKDFVNYAIGR